MDLPGLHKKALDFAKENVCGIKPEQWEKQSNCTEWCVRDLVNHLVSENWWVPELLAGKTVKEVGDTLEGDLLNGDPLHAYKDSADAAQKAVDNPDSLDKKVHVSWADIPAKEYIEQRIFDLTVHGWDIAKSTNQPDEIDKELLNFTYEVTEKNKAAFAESALFAKPIDVPETTDKQTKLLAMLGRQR